MQNYRNLGIKLTPQRIAILDYLKGNNNHPSAEEIFKHVSQNFSTMSFATVYNTLEALKKIGLISELTIDPSRKRYDYDTKPHHHLICSHCQKIVDVYSDYKLNVEEKYNREFEVLGNHIEFYGICKKCKETIN